MRRYLIAALLSCRVCAQDLTPDECYGISQTEQMTQGLVFYFSGDRRVTTNLIVDAGTYTSNGQMTALAVVGPGALNQAVTLTNGNDKAFFPTSPSFIGPQMTWSMWIRTNGFSNVRHVFGKNNTAATASGGWNILINDALAGGLECTVYRNGANSTVNVPMSIGWHHYVFTWDASASATNRLRGYRDLTDLTVVNATSADYMGTNTHGVYFACIQGYTNAILLGALDEVRVYNRVLSADERRAVYNLVAGVQLP